jgi:type III secretion protein U
MSEKTHEPSAKKLKEAREKGQVVCSRLFSASAVTLGGLVGTFAFLEQTTTRLQSLTRAALSLTGTSPTEALVDSGHVLALATAPCLLGAFAGALGSQLVTAGLQVNAEVVTPKLERLDVVEGVKKLFSLKQLIEIAKGLLVTVIIGLVLWRSAVELAPQVLRLPALPGEVAFPAALALWRPVVTKAAVLLVALGVGDLALARRRHRKDLMMSREDLKQEHKNAEGDPHQKSKQKSMRKQLANGGAARGVQKATAVVVNPTHLAIALRYDETECDAPYIVAKGQGADALKIRTDAQALDIPVVRDVPLARTLIHSDVGEAIPEELYQAAAAVLAAALGVKEDREETP